MPKEKRERKPIRLPHAMIKEVDRIIDKFPMYGNRQQFVESAVREKIEKVLTYEAKLQPETAQHP